MLTAVKPTANQPQSIIGSRNFMKKELHPTNYRPVVFQDLNNNETFLTKSTVATNATIKLDGVEYPLVKVHISSASHPFYTGQEKLMDIEGRVDKFKARQEAAKARAEAMKKKAQKVRTKSGGDEEVQKIGNLKRNN
jgi:large subunit ribosomal protein L31